MFYNLCLLLDVLQLEGHDKLWLDWINWTQQLLSPRSGYLVQDGERGGRFPNSISTPVYSKVETTIQFTYVKIRKLQYCLYTNSQTQRPSKLHAACVTQIGEPNLPHICVVARRSKLMKAASPRSLQNFALTYDDGQTQKSFLSLFLFSFSLFQILCLSLLKQSSWLMDGDWVTFRLVTAFSFCLSICLNCPWFDVVFLGWTRFWKSLPPCVWIPRAILFSHCYIIASLDSRRMNRCWRPLNSCDEILIVLRDAVLWFTRVISSFRLCCQLVYHITPGPWLF